MQTAKTIQMRDGSNNFISPATNIESLYYEAAGSDENQNVIFRHSISQHFPVYMNYGVNSSIKTYTVNTTKPNTILDISTKNAKIVNTDGQDIIISNYGQRRIKGTNYYALDVSSYNLSNILQSYAGITYTDNKILDLSNYIQSRYDVTINTINEVFKSLSINIENVSTSLDDTNKRVDNLKKSIAYGEVYTYQDLKKYAQDGGLVTGANYRMVYDPYHDISSGMFYQHKFDIVLNALNNDTFDTDVVACMPNAEDTYFNKNNLGMWTAKFDFNKEIETGQMWLNRNGQSIEYIKIVNRDVNLVLGGPDWPRDVVKVSCVYCDVATSNNYVIRLDQDVEISKIKKWINYEGPRSTTGDPIPLFKDQYLYVENMVPSTAGLYKFYQKTSEDGSIYTIDKSSLLHPTGLMVYLKDEFGNEAPFDFKNRHQIRNNEHHYLYNRKDNDTYSDYSLNPKCHDNIIVSQSKNVMFNINAECEIYDNYIGFESTNVYVTSNVISPVYNNIIQNDNNNVTLLNASTNRSCANNTIGHNNTNIHITSSYNNTIDDLNNIIDVAEGGDNNEIGSNCNRLSIDQNASFNIVECNANVITIKKGASYNVIEQGCKNIVIEENIKGVTFGPYSNKVSATESNTFYTYQKIQAREFETRW